MSAILNLATSHRDMLRNAAVLLTLSKITVVRFRFSRARSANRHVKLAAGQVDEMIHMACQRPEDKEDSHNYELVKQIEKLAAARVARISYAGRVLP